MRILVLNLIFGTTYHVVMTTVVWLRRGRWFQT